ncbi:MAG: outer membrane protein transport protein [Verrucomicrobiae bacterium]|nr:outer membrane protein transport protein [Verrucomicrobiae bacterium]
MSSCIVSAKYPRAAARGSLSVLTATLAATVGTVGTVGTHAEGFRSPTTGTAGLAATGGRIAFIDDASAVFHNPANLLELQRWEASAEPTFVHHSVRYTSPAGASARTEDPWKLLPHFFAGGPLVDDRVALGFGVSVPYGLSIDWGEGDALRYTAARYVELSSFNFNPSLAVRAADGLHLGFGLDVMYSELSLRRFMPLGLLTGIPGLPDGDLRLDGSGTGIGANFGVTWEFVPNHRLAATLRTPLNVNYDGNLLATGVPGVPGGALGAPFASRIRFPTILAVGYGWQITDAFRVEANLEWLEFSRFDTLPIGVPAAALGPFAGLLAPEIRQDWRDTLTVGVAGTWDLGSGWRLQASYQFFESPVPDHTFSPEIPDANQHAIAAGVGYRHGRHRLGLAYSRVFYADRRIASNQNPGFLGRYEVDVHLLSGAYGFSF